MPVGLNLGIVGLPNVGKSTLFNALTRNNVLAANYPFATIEPNEGVVPLPDLRLAKLAEIFNSEKIVPAPVTFVDIAGIVKGASEGAGLGDRFLRHVERTKLMLHLVDVSSLSGRDPVEDYKIINRELAAYNEDLAARPQIVVATKIDALDEPDRLESLRAQSEKDQRDFFAISSVTGKGVKELVNAIALRLLPTE